MAFHLDNCNTDLSGKCFHGKTFNKYDFFHKKTQTENRDKSIHVYV